MSDSSYQRLTDFLASAFEAEELEALARFVGQEFADSLPDSLALTRQSYIYEFVLQLRRRGLLDRVLFERLITLRSHRRREIDAIATALLSPVVRVHGGTRLARADLRRHWDMAGFLPPLVIRDDTDVPREFWPILNVLLIASDEDLVPDLQTRLRRAEQLGGPSVAAILWAWSGPAERPSFGELFTVFPGDRIAICDRSDRAEAWAEVLSGLEQLVPLPELPTDRSSPEQRTEAPVTRPVAEIFRTTGVPDVESYVEPAQHTDILARLDFMGEGLVIEGPSGIGKTTAVQRALEAHLGASLSALKSSKRLMWLQAKEPRDVLRLQRLVVRKSGLRGHVVIDDFHRLPHDLQALVADRMKLIADDSTGDTKLTLIGINPVGDSLVRDFRDLGGRFHVVSMRKQPDAKILELLQKCEALTNVEFARRTEFVRAARGSFFTLKLVCAEACLAEGVRETQKSRRIIVGRPDALILDRVQSRLATKYYQLLLQFASYDVAPPPRGAALMLLWLLSKRDEGSVAVDAARLLYPPADDGFRWFLASNLSKLFEEKPRLRDLFCYNREGGVLSIEDPQLEFYLGNLTWPAFARDSGHSDILWTEEGPRFQRPRESSPVRPMQTSKHGVQPESRVLHLSDLHFSTTREAADWAAQLREDLQHDLEVGPLTAVVLSGDLTNRATPDEFAAASMFIQDLRQDFKLESNQLIIVPGNHDLSWEASKESYSIHRSSDYKGPRDESRIVETAKHIEVLTDESRHRERFTNFAAFYFQACGQAYSLDYDYQATLHPLPSAKLLFVGFNSAWHIDHHFTGRAGIHSVALGKALRQIDSEPRYADYLRIAVWHHPIRSPDDDRIRDTGFMERLAQSGFRLALHGHIHRADSSQFRHDMIADGRRLDVLGAGTFGAPTREWQPGVPLQYQLLEIAGDRVRVRTRCRDNPQGAWRSDARWNHGPGQSAADSYDIDL